MTRYCLKILVVALIVIGLHFVILFTVRSPIPAAYPVRQMIAVKSYLTAQKPPPRIIFFGGSSVLMGTNAKQLGADLHVSAMNFGLQAGMRLEDLLSRAYACAKTGDTLVLALEPEYYSEQETWTDWQLRNALTWNRKAFDDKPLPQKFRILWEASTPLMSWDLVSAAIMQHIRPAQFKDRMEASRESDEALAKKYLPDPSDTSKSFAYKVSNLDDCGDALHNDDSRVHYWGAGTPLSLPGAISAHTQRELADFITEMSRRHVRVFFAHSPYIVDSQPSDDWKVAEQQFITALRALNGELLDNRNDLFYPRSYFFDTRLHLNAQGRQVHTALLTEALRKKLSLK